MIAANGWYAVLDGRLDWNLRKNTAIEIESMKMPTVMRCMTTLEV